MLCKTLCYVVQYVDNIFMQSFFDYNSVQKVVQYFVMKSAIQAILALTWQYQKLLHSIAYIAQFFDQYWNRRLGLQMQLLRLLNLCRDIKSLHFYYLKQQAHAPTWPSRSRRGGQWPGDSARPGVLRSSSLVTPVTCQGTDSDNQ